MARRTRTSRRPAEPPCRRAGSAAVAAVLALSFALPASGGHEQRLSQSRSPYLAMHAEDPVHWRDWTAAALAEARAANRLIYITSGYFACYWCHVMQRESFRDPAIAAFVNRHFVPVVVDRELHPGLDRRLMAFVEDTRGAGGWPLNVFLTPQGHPLIGLTYLPPEAFGEFLAKLQRRWNDEPGALAKLASEAGARRLSRPAQGFSQGPSPARLAARLLRQAFELADEFDGGFGEQSKFPMAPQLQALLELQARRPDPRVREFLQLTLRRMAARGLRDLVGGGFFRYTVDPGWYEPHFEKMLYDNAQLAHVYLRAAGVLDEPRWAAIGRDTLDFVLREMRHPEGGFVAALSALDRRGREGGYYLWQDEDLEAALGADRVAEARAAWAWHAPSAAEIAGHLPVAREDLDAEGVEPALAGAMLARMREWRARSRDLPRDGKRLTAWNALLLSALVEGARLDAARYGAAADGLRDFLVGAAIAGDAVVREPGGDGAATLDDYALLAQALADYAELRDSDADRALAARTLDWAWRDFHAGAGWRYATDPLLPEVASPALIDDAVLPSASAVVHRLTARFAHLPVMAARREAMAAQLRDGHGAMRDSPLWHASHIVLLLDGAG